MLEHCLLAAHSRDRDEAMDWDEALSLKNNPDEAFSRWAHPKNNFLGDLRMD